MDKLSNTLEATPKAHETLPVNTAALIHTPHTDNRTTVTSTCLAIIATVLLHKRFPPP